MEHRRITQINGVNYLYLNSVQSHEMINLAELNIMGEDQLLIKFSHYSTDMKLTIDVIGDGIDHLNFNLFIFNENINQLTINVYDLRCNALKTTVEYDKTDSQYVLNLYGNSDINLVGGDLRHVNNFTENRNCIGFLVSTSFNPLFCQGFLGLATYARHRSQSLIDVTVSEGLYVSMGNRQIEYILFLINDNILYVKVDDWEVYNGLPKYEGFMKLITNQGLLL